WLYRIAINTANNHLVSRGRRPPDVDIDVVAAVNVAAQLATAGIGTPAADRQRAEPQAVIDQALAESPAGLRTACALREFGGLSYEEITEIMGCPVGTVRSRIFRAREAIDARIRPLLED